MNCPICNTIIVEASLAGRVVYSCPNQHGLWFPKKVFKTVLRSLSFKNTNIRSNPDDILQNSVLSPKKSNVPEKKCPCCSEVLFTYNYCYNSNIYFDKCNKCEGLWLDKNELETAVLYMRGDQETIRKSIVISRLHKGYRRNISNLPRVCVHPPCPAPLAKKIDFVRKLIEAQYDKPGKIILSVLAWDTIVTLNHATSQIANTLFFMRKLGPEGKRHASYIILAIAAIIVTLLIIIFTIK